MLYIVVHGLEGSPDLPVEDRTEPSPFAAFLAGRNVSAQGLNEQDFGQAVGDHF